MTDEEICEARKLCEEATAIAPAPWYGNVKTSEVYLASVARGRIFAMDFARWGMAGAQPRFQVRLTGEPGSGIMQKLVSLPTALPTDLGPQMVGSHRNDCIGHPVARLLAAAPELVARLLDEVNDLEGWREQCAAHPRGPPMNLNRQDVAARIATTRADADRTGAYNPDTVVVDPPSLDALFAAARARFASALRDLDAEAGRVSRDDQRALWDWLLAEAGERLVATGGDP